MSSTLWESRKFVEETREMLMEIIADQQKIKRTQTEWCVFLKGEEKPIGNCGLFIHPTRFRKGEIYYNIYPD
jgi:RimJ/RimL family protein N-acetyltransferase